jgi:predicted TIM-barrel fold metal-dependent hydrolase
MTSYVAQMNAAWHAFVAFGRPEHPRLRVVFALLAGGAPFHLERLAARGGPAERAHDPLLFYDTSSYGPRAIDTAARFVGVDQLVHGSDRPLAEPPAWSDDDAFAHALRVRNPERLLGAPA